MQEYASSQFSGTAKESFTWRTWS